ncbi:MAG: response regulator [Hadesarchaea archaeon]|nr:response regulator [Hadesarchaea archaeon]
MAKKILVLDDDPSISKAVKILLESEGFKVKTAQDWQECLAKLKKEKPDLILLDILMPTIVGISALRLIRESLPQTKVIMLSVLGSKICRQLSSELGAVDFITKPFDNQDLIQRVKRALGMNAALEQIEGMT